MTSSEIIELNARRLAFRNDVDSFLHGPECNDVRQTVEDFLFFAAFHGHLPERIFACQVFRVVEKLAIQRIHRGRAPAVPHLFRWPSGYWNSVKESAFTVCGVDPLAVPRNAWQGIALLVVRQAPDFPAI